MSHSYTEMRSKNHKLLIKLRRFLAGPRSARGNRSTILGAFAKVLKATINPYPANVENMVSS